MADEFELLVRRVQELPAEVAAYETRAYFDSLAPDAARRLAETRPDEVGSLDGRRPYCGIARTTFAWSRPGTGCALMVRWGITMGSGWRRSTSC